MLFNILNKYKHPSYFSIIIKFIEMNCSFLFLWDGILIHAASNEKKEKWGILFSTLHLVFVFLVRILHVFVLSVCLSLGLNVS